MQKLDTLIKQALTWRVSLTFATLATFITITVGWLSSVGLFPIYQAIEYSKSGLQFIRVWLGLAIAIGLILPTMALIAWFKHPELRKIFGFYLLLLIIQIITEQIISSIWLSSLVVVIGTLYTAFRVWQLWQGLHLIQSTQALAGHKLSRGLLWLLFFFWSSNLIMLFTLGWSSILWY